MNGSGSEYYFTIDSESNKLYYARSAPDDLANLDLHSFPVPMEAHPEAVAKLKGTLVDSRTKKPMRGIVSIIDLDKGVEVAPKFLREVARSISASSTNAIICSLHRAKTSSASRRYSIWKATRR